MNNEGRDINWEWLRAFVTVAEQGSLNKAAETLTVSQPTLSRHLNALEKHTGVLLFHRTTQGVSLTPEGEALLVSAMPMREAYDAFSRALQGNDDSVEGEIRLSANELMAHHYIADHLVAFRREHPAISVELVVSNQQANISRREADVAIRMFRPQQLELKCRRIGSVDLGFYCHRSLTDEVKPLTDAENPFGELPMIGFDKDDTFIRHAAQLGINLTVDDFQWRTDSLETQIALLRAGGGIGIMHKNLAEKDKELVQIWDEVAIPSLDVWLVCHRDSWKNARIRALINFLSSRLGADLY
ncbi:LysR family transcriptional regulator [Veronia pacifica]|uniref:HTH lysR-type domain-containing protein n=1 Tax=Veronia pacifica TaxID=1080227 RepID=A0A1C3EEF5_9GAMM|nr:LysR family transcriptional regulator [Veronia pacifica]ODA31600.1 hypothetical protein A8L45_16385 [Veronia pacifica]